jgi:hypothetical protein
LGGAGQKTKKENNTMKTTPTGYPINKNGKVIKTIPNEVKRIEFLGNIIKQNGSYLYFRFKRDGYYIYSHD